METLKAKLTRVLTGKFPRATVAIHPIKPLAASGKPSHRRNHSSASTAVAERSPGKVSGFVVWKDFEGMDQVDRQGRVWDVLRAELSPDEQLRITAILTMTPAER